MKPYSKYHQAIKKEFDILAENSKVLYIGQQCSSESFYGFLEDIPNHSRREMPVCEELQLGLSIGLALEGYLPVCIYQRMDFLPRAMDQLVNHLDLLKEHSRNMYNPKIIIFTTIGSSQPLDVGLQHKKDLIEGLELLLPNINIYELLCVEDINEYFKLAIESKDSSILVARQEYFYENKQ